MSYIKKITILGATGSIGVSTLEILRQHPKKYQLEAVTAQNNLPKLIEIAKEFSPSMVAIANDAHYAELKSALAGSGIEIAAGESAIIEAAQRPAELVMAAIVGVAGLRPVLAAIARGATIALANKESLVSAGELVLRECRKYGAELLPVDSEHNAIFQVFNENHRPFLEKITLTASGGPFRGWSAQQLQKVTPEQAVRHPNWSMGKKISVDSASLMNKGLELIEACHLFALKQEQVEVVVHPESIIHSLVHYADGSVLAQLGLPDMLTPISYCLAWPERLALAKEKMDLIKIAALHFEAVNNQNFPCLQLARDAFAQGGGVAAAMNAANEVAVARFLDKEIDFLSIARIIEKTLLHGDFGSADNLEEILEVDARARIIAQAI